MKTATTIPRTADLLAMAAGVLTDETLDDAKARDLAKKVLVCAITARKLRRAARRAAGPHPDAARLDWLEESRATVGWAGPRGWWCRGIRGDSCRGAVDRAMREFPNP